MVFPDETSALALKGQPVAPTRPVARILIVTLVVGLSLAACGRRGPLEPPPGAPKPPPVAEGEVVRPGVPRATNPDRKFILDGLL